MRALILCILCFTSISYAETTQYLVPITKQEPMRPQAFSSEASMKTVCVQDDCYYVVSKDTADKLVRDGIAETYEPVIKWKLHAAPNDKFFSQQWEYNNSEWLAAWELLNANPTGLPVVAIIDSGFYAHDDFSSDRLYNGTYYHVSGWLDGIDTYGHGSHVAGIIAAQTNNSKGIASVSGGKVMVMPIKVTDGEMIDNVSIMEAINLVLAEKALGANIVVVNMSFGGGAFSQAVYDAIVKLNNAGILVVASAGNENQDLASEPIFPASYDAGNIIAVASSDQYMSFSSRFSNYGGPTGILAPGEGIISLFTEQKYASASGTSMSAPFVAGMLSAGAALYDGITAAQLVNLLYSSATKNNNMLQYATEGRMTNVQAFYSAVLACRQEAINHGSCTVANTYPQKSNVYRNASGGKSGGSSGGCSIASGTADSTAWDWLLLALAIGLIGLRKIRRNFAN